LCFLTGGQMREKNSLRAAAISALLVAALSGGIGIASAQSACTAGQTSAAFSFTGGAQTFVVPAFVTSAVVHVKGAQGGSGAIGGNSVSGGTGGLGSTVSGTLTLTPGDTLNILVGGQGATPVGGFNGGANGGSQNAGGGGGASDIRIGGLAAANRVVVAGGGGGGGRGGCHEGSGTGGVGGIGGAGGGGSGVNGADSPQSNGVAGGGAGAVGSAAGAVGVGCGGFLGTAGAAATAENGGTGGAGQTCCCSSSNSIPGGGGGVGGLVGGGGGGGGSAGTTGCAGNSKGAGGGGAGGTNGTSSLTAVTATNGVNLGNGSVELCYTPLPPVNGVCGSANGVAVGLAPSSNLCSAGTATVPTSAASQFTWSCTGANGGTDASCAAPRQYTVTPSVSGGNGTAVGGGAVVYNGTGSVTITPNSGFAIATPVGGTCGGTLAGNTYTTNPVTADCTVVASFVAIVNAVCGTANGAATTLAPSANLCNPGTASSVASAVSQFTWSCTGANSGTDASCAAPRQYTVTPSVSGGNGTAVGGGAVVYNGTGSVTITPNAGFFTVTPIGGTCGGSLSGSTFTTAPVTADCSVIASFTASITPGVSASPAEGGSISCTPQAAVGGTSTCTVVVNSGFVVASVSGCGGTPTSGTTYVTAPINAACVVSVAFALAVTPVVPVFSGLWAWVLAAFAIIASGIALRRRGNAMR
jgi:hypothetical protein